MRRWLIVATLLTGLTFVSGCRTPNEFTDGAGSVFTPHGRFRGESVLGSSDYLDGEPMDLRGNKK